MIHSGRPLSPICVPLPSSPMVFPAITHYKYSWAILTLTLFAAGCATSYRPQVHLTAVQTHADLDHAMTTCQEKAHKSIPTGTKELSIVKDTIGTVVVLLTSTPLRQPAFSYTVSIMYKDALEACLKEQGYTIVDTDYATDEEATITHWEETFAPLPDSQHTTQPTPVSPAPAAP